MPKFIAKTTILRNGKTIAEGAELQLTDEEAAQMLASSSIELAPEPAKKPGKDEK